jgi:hypothetical protein
LTPLLAPAYAWDHPNKEAVVKTSIAVLVLLVVAVGTVYTQTPPPVEPQSSPPGLPSSLAPNVPAIPQPKETTLDELLDQIEKVRAQKAELEKKEKALMAEARKLLDKQLERLNKLGLGIPAQPPPAVDFGVTLTPSTPPSLVPPAIDPFPIPKKP